MDISSLYQLFRRYPSVQTDTRKLQQGDLYFALKGANFNGNQFALQALEKGAAYAIVDEAMAIAHPQIILVEDVLSTLQALALYHRQQLGIPVIAITGSNGKTTTKELVHAVLSSHFKTYTTKGNLNNHIGVPLTLLSIQPDAEIAVVEMGANHQKEIESYCSYTEPTHGIITNCGKAHLEGFGGIEGVRKGKGELYDFLRSNNGTVFLFDDYDYLQQMSAGIPNIIRYGTASGLVQGHVAISEPFLEVSITEGLSTKLVKTQLVGSYNLPNVLCALTVGKHLQVPEEKMIAAIEQYTPSNSRSQLVERGSNKIILDAYNANPSSVRLAIENFAKLAADHKIILLGGMMELGEESVAEHQTIADLIAQHSWDQVVLVGGDFSKVSHQFTYLQNSLEAKAWLQQLSPENSYLLIKGSRSMQMEKILEP
ncbi:MAG TPA: UDP-N-acetylmuramoylalanyl-D-glutamate--2,6-diaminopimelate ligase [Chitinophagaceae bacterium]|nr:UDP-N-acetylmuramoylalanyl-D-glutamate--2,6-diaminopimelate ligase [Chitinophagaceae bacterium]